MSPRARLHPDGTSFAPLVDAVGGHSVVLDGELVAGQGTASDFYRVLSGVATTTRRSPLTFVAFDVLAFDGPVIDAPYQRRREMLAGLELSGPAWCTAPVLSGSVVAVLAACAAHDIEGIVAKLRDEMRGLARLTKEMRPRIHRVFALSQRVADMNDFWAIVEDILGITEMRELALLIGWFLDEESTIDEEGANKFIAHC